MGLKIKAYLNRNEGGCDYSGYFEETWVNNTKLHPAVKKISVDKHYGDRQPIIQVIKDDTIIFEQVGNRISTAQLQEFLLAELGLTGK